MSASQNLDAAGMFCLLWADIFDSPMTLNAQENSGESGTEPSRAHLSQ